MFTDPHFWVAVAFFVFIALAYKHIAKLLASTLDTRTLTIKTELDEARRLREEAQQVLAAYQQKQAEYLQEAERMLLEARNDADIISRHAQETLQATLAERMQHALDNIAREEKKAVQDVRNHVVDIALATARAVIREQMSKMPQKDLVKLAMSDIERKIH